MTDVFTTRVFIATNYTSTQSEMNTKRIYFFDLKVMILLLSYDRLSAITQKKRFLSDVGPVGNSSLYLQNNPLRPASRVISIKF